MTIISPVFVYQFGSPELLEKYSLAEIIGLKTAGLFSAAVLPLLLTVILFLGPIAMFLLDVSPSLLREHSLLFSVLQERFRVFCVPMFWRQSLKDWIWWRNHVVAPFSEEFTFRACMVPVLLGKIKSTGWLELLEILRMIYLQVTTLSSGPSSSVHSSLEWLISTTWWRGSGKVK